MKICFLGGGNMASALIGGLTRQGFPPADIAVIEPRAEQREKLVADFGVHVHESEDREWLPLAEILVLAVKPQQMKAALAPLADQLSHQIVISIAAGLSLDTLSRWLAGYRRIVRAMPNTPALVGQGMTGLFAAPEVSLNEKMAAQRVLEAAGQTLWVEDEAMMDAVTAISGSGPAYFFHLIETMEAAAVDLGFAPDEARRLVLQTALGAVDLACDAEEPAAVLREKVTSKGGTTEAALNAMAEAGVAQGVTDGVRAAKARSAEMSAQLGRD
jgi:pyrroline-5-carboxylate reductase